MQGILFQYPVFPTIVLFASLCFPGAGAAQSDISIPPSVIVEPTLLHPDSVSVTYHVEDGCDLDIGMKRSADGRKLTELKINFCSKEIDIDEACRRTFVEPNLGAYALLVAGYGASLGDWKELREKKKSQPAVLFVATRMQSVRKKADTDPPFVRIEFSRYRVVSCTEVTSIN